MTIKNFLSKIFKKRAQAAETSAPERAPALKRSVSLFHETGSDKVVLKNLVLNDAQGNPLVDFGDLTLKPGDRMVLSGPAGCGKSAGLAAMRDAWMLGGSGEITLPPEVRFVPQEEYFPDRTLRGIVCAPDLPGRFTTEQVARALTEAGLSDFVEAMDEPTKRGEYWKNTLSGGQKNKLSFAGIFLHAEGTKLLIVDEITAALDAKSEKELYPKLLERMNHGIVICVAHHASLIPQHNLFAVVADGKVTYSNEPPPAAKPHESASAQTPANANELPAAKPAKPAH